MENQNVQRYLRYLVHEKSGRSSIKALLTRRLWADYLDLGSLMRDDAERYIEEFTQTPSGKAVLKRAKRITIMETHLMIRSGWGDVEDDILNAIMMSEPRMSANQYYDYATTKVYKLEDHHKRQLTDQDGIVATHVYNVPDVVRGHNGSGYEVRDFIYSYLHTLILGEVDHFVRMYTVGM